jgi:hypothetical protein
MQNHLPQCPLCHNENISLRLSKDERLHYWDCGTCSLLFLDQKFHLDSFEEQGHYLKHNNDVNDPRYQKFLSPVTDFVLQSFSPPAEGLDYGAGPGPVVTEVLRSHGFEMNLYDPFFWQNTQVLEKQYDFIIASEVVEHFYRPGEEFKKLKNLMKEDASLIIMTHLFDESIDFKNWYYQRDPTHVAFYQHETFEWIRKTFNFKSLLRPHPRVVVLKL